jgi:uncharacterized protein
MGTALATELERVCRDRGAIAVYVFGSRAAEIAARVRGQEALPERTSSDVDLGVLLPRGMKLCERDRVRLAAELEDLLGVARVDVVLLGEASPFLAVEAVSGELLLDLRPRETVDFELFALRRAGDLLQFQRARTEAVLEEGGR